MIIRLYEEKDRLSVRRICCDTAFMGEDVANFLEDREVFADFAISYYTDYEPQSLFVAQSEDSVIGYIAGCRDTKRYEQIFKSRILPNTILRCLARGLILKPKSRKFIYNTFKSFLKGEFKRPEISKEYPAHLHINIDGEKRRLGTGLMLMNRLLEYFKEQKVYGVHLTSVSKIGQEFFFKYGFKKLYSIRVSYFDYLVKEPVELICFGKKL